MDSLLHLTILAIIAVILWSDSSETAVLNEYILDYQSLEFNPSHLHEKHNRVKRQADPHLQWTFKAYDRTFNLQLQPSRSVFAEGHEVVLGNNTPQAVDTSFIYEGKLADDPSSSAFISIIHGSVSGHIVIPGHTTYHIEPARNHFEISDIHTIIYPESQMNLDPFRHKRETSETCGTKEIYSKLKKMWQPLELDNRNNLKTHRGSAHHNKYSAEMNTEDSKIRRKRDLQGNNRTCIMSLQADTLLYNHFLNKYGEAERAKEGILALFASHITALNEIYGKTLFERADDQSVYFRGINFQLQRSKIMDTCPKPGFCTDNLDVSNFLDLTAEENLDQFCLAHTFTYRDFVGGTLGLAWVATPDSPNAGACGKYGTVRDVNNVISKRSLNTGIVTLINFKQDVPARVSQLTFAHEVGHNFGSEHDKTEVCAPYGTRQPDASSGNYIMFPSATQGNLPNNAKFSSCSKDYIAKVLATLVPGGKRVYCFQDSSNSFCGNKIVESGETCDCGFRDDCQDKCCNSQDCKLTDTAACSPSQGPCCNTACQIANSSMMCMNETECAGSSYCTLQNATCPPPSLKKGHEMFCSDNTKVCESGECIASVCKHISWEECFLTSSETSDIEQMCYVSCRKSNSTECISSFDQQKVKANPDFDQLLQKIRYSSGSNNSFGVKRPAGSPCNDYKGYCDVFSKCRNVDAEGPFKQLTDLIFNPVTLKNIRTWIEDRWWAVLLMCVGVVVFMGVFVKIFEYNTPNKDPNNQPPPSSRSHGVSRPQHHKRSGAHNNDVPMYDRGGHAKGPDYHNYAFQSSSPGRGQRDGQSWSERY